MLNITCAKCGAELAEGAKFCRQCGEPLLLPAAGAGDLHEAATQTFEPFGEGSGVTHQLNPPQPTSPNYQASEEFPPLQTHPTGVAPPVPRQAFVRNLLIVAIVAGLVAVSVVTVLMSRKSTSDSGALVYPGAETIVDMQGTEGSTLHLRTRDSFDKVTQWYVTNLKPTKTIRISATSVILKTGARTITIVTEDNETNVVIKQAT
ncbi:MAG: zinc ribbon domain-containing protein [Pyrinomonadaceae bacterium]